MRKILIFTLIFLSAKIVYGLSIFEPSIECTVIKVHAITTFSSIKDFPKLYQSINNNPVKSTLRIAGLTFPNIKPETMLKTDTFERILIADGVDSFLLDLNGKPISRNGSLKKNGKLLADVTCH